LRFGLRSFGSRSSVIEPPAASIFSRALAETACAVTVQVAVTQDLDVGLGVLEHALLDKRLGRDLRARVEALLERGDVDRRRRSAERADRKRVRRAAAQLSEAHVDRVLAALEARAHLVRARARLLPLEPAARVAPLAGAQAAADALAVLARLGGLQVREVQILRHRCPL